MNPETEVSMFVWMSFCDPDSGNFLGVIITEVPNIGSSKSVCMRAIKRTHKLKINPGGEVQMFPFPKGESIPPIEDKHLDKLFSVSDLSEFGFKPHNVG